MKHFICATAVVLSVSLPSYAQQDDGSSLIERGAQQFLEELLREMEPAWDGMREFLDQMGPAMLQLLEDIEDWSRYEPPEVLENGDIIIRRKPDPETAPEVSPDPEPMPQIEL